MNRIVLATVTLLALAAPALAGPAPIRRSDLPSPVIYAIEQRYPKGRILALARDTHRGEARYHAEVRLHGQRIRATFGPKGRWHEEAAEIRFVDAPAAVRNAFQHETRGRHTLVAVERRTVPQRRAPRYAFQTRSDGAQHELLFDKDGQLLKNGAAATTR